MSQDTVFYIYLLRDPSTKQVRYVGCTCDPQRRLSQHIKQAQGVAQANLRNARIQWLRSLSAIGHNPIMEIVDTCREDERAETERYWIAQFLMLGTELTNVQFNDNVSTLHRPRHKIDWSKIYRCKA